MYILVCGEKSIM
uniref:Uncharacterized protein n=1 Tax=Rhizophora mucronata TaxID=61149 RepID=A0A2P2KIR5_RHIMU